MSRWVLAFGIFAVGCGMEKKDAATVAPEQDDDVTTVRSNLTFNTTVYTPLGWMPEESAVSALGVLRINDRVIVRDAATGLPAPVNNLAILNTFGPYTTNIGVDARVGTVLSRAATTLRDRATVLGSVYTMAPVVRQNGVVIALFDKEDIGNIPVDQSRTRAITWPANVQPGQMLDPGGSPADVALGAQAYQFAVAKSGRGIILRGPGEYFFDYLTIEPGGRLIIEAGSGPVTVHLKQNFTLRGTMSGTRTPFLAIPSFTVIAQGNGLNSLEQNFTGVLVAPFGSISVSGGRTVRGALQGGYVEVHQGAVVEHVRDSRYLNAFNDVFVARTQVTGGSMRRSTSTEVTDEALQSEAVTAITAIGSNIATVVVGYNDKSESPGDPKAIYPLGRTGNQRILRKGVSISGWSYSLDGGRTFTYGGRVVPPAGWSATWGDPTMAKVSLDDPVVFYAVLASSTAAFEGTSDGNTDRETIVDENPNLDGRCVARSSNGGITFPEVACAQLPNGAIGTDSTTVAAGLSAGRRVVFVTGVQPSNLPLWKLDGDATPMTVTQMPNIQVTGGCSTHPRIRVSGGLLYVVCENSAFQIVGNTLDIATSTWQTPRIIATGATTNEGFGSMRIATSVSFDVGTDGFGDPKVRVMYQVEETGAGGKSLALVQCQPNLTGCVEIQGWGTRGMPGWEAAPSLRYQGAGRWAASFMTENNQLAVGMSVGFLATNPPNASGGTPILRVKVVAPPVPVCPLFGRLDYWGDYNEMDTYGPNFGVFVPYTMNGPANAPDCRYTGDFMADQHVGGASVAQID